jgi:hypothetical protein
MMELSLKLIMDELGFEADMNLPPEQNPRFSFAELYTPSGSDLSGDKLLICGLSEALAAPRNPGLYFLCVRDRMVDDSETPEAMAGITVIRRNIELRVLFNRVQRIFLNTQTWLMKMEQSVSANKGLQDLLTLSEPIFKNHIVIQDSTFKLLYYTKGIHTTDDITNKLIEHGYHPPETLQLFQKLRRLEEYEKNHDLIISRDYATSEYEVVKKMFHTGGSISIQVVMVCCGRAATDAVIELFKKLLEYIKLYVDRDSASYGGSNAVKTLALDLIMKNVASPDEARNRAAYAGFPFEGNFRLVVVSFDDEGNIPLSRLVQSVAEVFPQASVFSQNRNVLILDIERGETAQFKAVIDKALTTTKFYCGISSRFNCLWDINIAYEQAILAVMLAGQLKSASDGSEHHQDRIYCQFSDYWIYHLLSAGIRSAPVVYKNAFLFQSLDILKEYDAAHRTDTLNLLRIYLENERKATIVSTLLHMHRNTVLYHIGKIESILGVSLDDPEVRLKLQLAYKANDFKPGVFHPGNELPSV